MIKKLLTFTIMLFTVAAIAQQQPQARGGKYYQSDKDNKPHLVFHLRPPLSFNSFNSL